MSDDERIEGVARAMWEFLADKQDDEHLGICRNGPHEREDAGRGRYRWRAQRWDEASGGWRKEMLECAAVAIEALSREYPVTNDRPWEHELNLMNERGGSAMSEPFHAIHHDAQDDRVVVGCYDIGVGPTVVFDGGGFTDPARLRALAADLERGAAWLAALPAKSKEME